jgi:thiol-disulfide isomerase/thioredoxin
MKEPRHAPVSSLVARAAALALACWVGPAATAAATPSAASTVAAAPAARLVDPQQLGQVLAGERGKIVILNLWGTWCAPCLREIPELVRLQRDLAARGVVLIGVAMDEPGELASLVEPFRLKYFPAFQTYVRNAPDMDSVVSVVDPAWNEILPTTYLIGRDGKVARKIQGVRTYEQFRGDVLAVADAATPGARP